MRFSTHSLVVAPVLLALAVCTAQGPDEARVIGEVDFDATFPRPWVEVPDSVIAGRSFVVTLLTAGGGCIRGDEHGGRAIRRGVRGDAA